MQKEELLFELERKINIGEISKNDIEKIFESHIQPSESVPSNQNITLSNKSHSPITKLLYGIGGIIMAVGVIFFIAQVWGDIGSFGRIMVTLGLGLVFTGIGSFVITDENARKIGSLFQFIGGILIPIGSMVLIDELMYESGNLWAFIFAFCIMFIFYLVLALTQEQLVFSFFTIAHATTLMYLLITQIYNDTHLYDFGDSMAYLTMVIGFCYLLLSYAVKETWSKSLDFILQFFGIIFIMSGAFSRVFNSQFWEFLFFIFVITGIYLATVLKSQMILIVSSLFLVFHLIYITNEYFADSLGWPISLVFLGLIFVGLGFMSININRKYIKV